MRRSVLLENELQDKSLRKQRAHSRRKRVFMYKHVMVYTHIPMAFLAYGEGGRDGKRLFTLYFLVPLEG